jgi:hypothetical protein
MKLSALGVAVIQSAIVLARETLNAHRSFDYALSAPWTGHARFIVQIGGSARGYQANFVSSTALASPGYDGQPAVYLYIAALEVNVLNCRQVRVG